MLMDAKRLVEKMLTIEKCRLLQNFEVGIVRVLGLTIRVEAQQLAPELAD